MVRRSRVEQTEPRPPVCSKKVVHGMKSLSPSQPGQRRARIPKGSAGAFLALMLAAVPLCGQKTAHVEIDFKTELAQVPAAGYGVGMSVYDGDFTSPTLPARLKAAGVTALRYPGGSYADAYHWKTHAATEGTKLWINANDTFDHFMTMDVIPSGAQAIITVNYGSNQAGTGGGDPARLPIGCATRIARRGGMSGTGRLAMRLGVMAISGPSGKRICTLLTTAIARAIRHYLRPHTARMRWNLFAP